MKDRIIFLGLLLILRGIALVVPCLSFNEVYLYPGGNPSDLNDLRTMYGADVRTMYGFELIYHYGIIWLRSLQIPAIAWFANPIYWLCCLAFLMRRYRFSAIAGIAAILIGFGGTVSAFWFNLPADSRGDYELALSQFLGGFWLWLATPGLVAIASIIRLLKEPPRLTTRSD